MSLRLAALKSVMWSALETGSTTVISTLSLIIFAKLLEPRDFGAYSVALATIEIAGIFTNMFFYEALIQYQKAREEHFDATFSASIFLSIVFFASLWVALPFLASLVGDPRVSDIGRALAVGLLVTGPVSVLTARQSRELGFRVLALRTLVGRVAGAVIGICAAFYGFGVWALVIQYLAMTLLGSVTLVYFSSWSPRFTTNWKPIGDVLHYSVGSVIALSTGFLIKRAFVFYVGVFLGVEKAGFLNLAFRLIDTVWSVSAAAISQVLLPLMATLQNDRERVLKAYSMSLVLGSVVLFPVFTGIGAVAPEIITLMFGEKWLPAAPLTLWLSLLVFSQSTRIFQSSVLKITGHIGDVRTASLVALATMGIGIAATRFSSEAIALVVWSAADLVNSALLSYFVQRRLALSMFRQFKLIMTPLLVACAMAALVYWSRGLLSAVQSVPILLAILCLIGVVVYLALLTVFGRGAVLQTIRWLKKPKEA